VDAGSPFFCDRPMANTMSTYFPTPSAQQFWLKALAWASAQEYFTLLHSNDIAYPNGTFPKVLATGCKAVMPTSAGNTFKALHTFSNNRWAFGYLGYDLKNEIENLHSNNTDGLQYREAFFYEPEVLLFFEPDGVRIEATHPADIFTQIELAEPVASKTPEQPVFMQQRVSREHYMATVQQIREHIEEGNVYELNYCMEFYNEQTTVDPLSTFLALTKRSPMPFAAFQRIGNQYLMCASPERFLKKTGDHLVSQPIKGTARRDADPARDALLKEQLLNSEKERAENMMIVDLVRNDLARSSVPGTIQVDEMFGIYSFQQVHQMISTVSSTLRPGLPFTEGIRNAFPMGSMTGAPKIRAMQLIEELESSKRGLFSGAVGYITPNQDFDFNVVIRSLFYNQATGYLSFQVGSAITYDSVAEQEWDECMLKAKAMLEVLGAGIPS
jgi:para-aminobenzoate synthetase component I